MRWRTSGRSANRTTCWISALPPSSAGCDFPATISWIGLSSSSSSCSSRSGSRSISVSRLYVGTRRANPMVSTFGSNAVEIQPNSASDAPRSSHERRNRRRTSSTSSARSCERIHHRWPGVDLLQPQPDAGVAERVRPGQLAAQLQPLRRRPGTRVNAVGDRPDRHLVRVESGPQLVEHGPAHPAVQQRDTVGALRQPQAHVGHVEFRRIVLGAEREDPGGRYARQQHGRTLAISVRAFQRDRHQHGRRSSAAPCRSGTGRYRRAPGCGW